MDSAAPFERPVKWLVKALNIAPNDRVWNWLAMTMVLAFVSALVYDGIKCRCLR